MMLLLAVLLLIASAFTMNPLLLMLSGIFFILDFTIIARENHDKAMEESLKRYKGPCTYHKWEYDSNRELYCLNCNARPGID